MRTSSSSPNSFKILLGLVIAGFGLIATFEKYDLLQWAGLTEPLFAFWPALLVLVGLVKLLAVPGESFSGLVFSALGCLLLVTTLTDRLSLLDLLRFWPLILVLIGIGVVFRSFGGPEDRWLEIKTPRVRQLGLLSSSRRRATSQVFAGGDLGAFMGGCELDLREARPTEDGAVLDVATIWGGIEVKVPKGWQIDLRVTPVMGGAEDKTQSSAEKTDHRLRIRGFALMGGIEVHN